ncbi:hypothetical protein HKD37_19G053834 [Glycine soja]
MEDSTYKTNRRDAFPGVIVTDRDLVLMHVVKTVFPECTNLLCRFHIDKNVKAKCKSLVGQKNAWDYASFETSTHVVGHVFKVTLYKRLLGMISRYALNQIAVEFERVYYANKNPSCYGCVIRTTHGLPCTCELSKYVFGMSKDSWSLVRNHLLKELVKWSDEYINLFGGIDRFEELKRSLLVTMDKWMNINDIGYVIASRCNVILVFLSLQQSITFFSLRSQLPTNSSVHRVICIDHVYVNHFVQVYLRDRCPLPPLVLLRSRNCHPQAKQWPTSYISRM